MSTLASLRNLVVINLGGRNDATAVEVIDAAINYGVLIAAMMFQPPELKREDTTVLSSGNNKFYLSLFTRLFDLISIYNNTAGSPLWFVPYEQFDIVVPSSGTNVKFYTVFGNTVYVKPTPTSTTSLKVAYVSYPDVLSEDDDEVEFDYYDPYIVAVASALAMAAFEEVDSATMWQKVSESLYGPFLLGQRAREVIAQRKTLFEAVVAQMAGEGGGK